MLAYRARLLAFATDFHLVGNEHSGNHGHAGRPGEVGGSAPAATSVTTGKDVERHMAPALASAAQAVYDEWDENEDVYAGGGICHIIAEEMAGKLIEKGIEATTVSNQIGEQHVWVVAKLDDGVYSIDIPPGTYETGGGYSWKKRQGVEITKDDVIVDRIDRDPSKFEDYLDMSFQLGGEGSGNFDHAGRPGQVGGSSKSVHDTLPIRGTKEQIEALVQRYGFTVTKITRDHAAGEDWHAVEVEGDDRTQLDLLTEATETPTQADKPPRRPIFKSPREKARIAAEARRREGGAVGHAQRERDWRMQRGRDQQRIIRAIRKRDAEGKSLFSQALDAILLEGNEHSGNYGHAGRPGQVGGSASGPAAGIHIANSKEQIDRGHYLQEANHHIARSELTPELEEAFNWASKNPATPILTMDSTVTFRPLGKTPLRWTASNGVEIVKAFDAGGSFHDYNPKNEMAVPLNVEKPRSEYGDADSEYAEMDEEDYQRENAGKHTVEAATAALEEWSRKFVIPIAQARWEAKQARGLSDDIHAIHLGGEGSGNFGHEGRPGEVGGSGPGGEHASIINTFREKLRPADSYNSTHFILPDGTRLSHSEDTHWGAAEKLGVDLGKALQAGVLRYNVGSGGEIGHPITEQQAQHLIDGHLFTGGNQPLHVDVFIGPRQASKSFDPDRDTADTIRHWVNDKFSGVPPVSSKAWRKAPIAVGRIAASDDWKQQLLDLFVEALNLDGTSEGAVKGWETRRGGGGSEAESIPAGKQGECFRNAARWIRTNDDFDLVHGKVTNGAGRTFDHAWAESDKQVADPTTGVKMDKDRWYGLVQAKPEARYSSAQATRNMLRTQNFGPWTEEEVGTHKLSALHLYGTDKSGNYGHAGRPGQVGGSAPGDSGGTTQVRKYERDEGFAIFESPEMEAYVKGLPPADIDAIDSYGGFTYGDINGLLRGTFTPRIVNEVVRDATPEEAASWKGTGRSHASEYPADDPINKVEDGRIVRQWHYKDGYKPEGGNVQIENFVIEKAGPDQKYVKELESKADTINEHIRERGHALQEAVSVNRAAYIPGMSYEDLKAMEGATIEEKGFTSTMVGDPNGRLDSYVMHGKTESIYKRFGNLDIEHQREVGVPMRIEVVLPEGTKVAAVEATRRATVDYERIPDPEAYEDYKKRYPADTDLKPEHFTKPDRTKPTITTKNLHNTDQRKEAEFLLGSGAKFRVVSVNKAAKPISWPGDGSILPIDVIDVKLEYIGGGSSEATRKKDLRFDFGNERSGNYGHAGRIGQVGGSAPSKGRTADAPPDPQNIVGQLFDRASGLNKRPHEDYQPVEFATDPRDTKLLLPDGTRLAGNGEHGDVLFEALIQEGTNARDVPSLNDAMRAGVARYSAGAYGGVQIQAPLTQHQAEVIADDWNVHYRADEVRVDMWGDDGKTLLDIAVIKTPVTADRLRRWSQETHKKNKIAASSRYLMGGEGSGNFGHAGRIGEVGGSGPSSTRTSSPQFKAWFKDSAVVDEDGEPLRVYHGTTHDIESFKEAGAEGLNVEGNWGAGIYFTSSPEDAGENYAGEGPDLTSRIEQRADEIENETTFQKWLDEPKEDRTYQTLENVGDSRRQAALAQARQELAGKSASVIPAYLSIQKPFVMGEPNGSSSSTETRFDRELEYENPDDSDSDIIGEKGMLPDLIAAIHDEAAEYEHDESALEDAVAGLGWHDSMTASQVQAAWFNSRSDLADDEGRIIHNEILRGALQRMGFDGVVDRTVKDKFGKMKGVNPDTTHFIAFYPTQIKSAIGNVGAFDPKSTKIAASYREKLQQFLLGGEGSGNFGHAGRPGEVGGSATGGKVKVFHTTPREITEFRVPYGFGGIAGVNGIHFTTRKDFSYGANRYPVELDVKNTLKIDTKTLGGRDPYEVMRERLSDDEYDSVAIHWSGDGSTEWIVFDPKQAKITGPVQREFDWKDVDEGLNTQYESVAEHVQRYTHNNERSGIAAAMADDDYPSYRDNLHALLKKAHGDRVTVTRKSGYAGGSGEGAGAHVSVSTLPDWKGEKFSVAVEDVALAGHSAEGELIVKRSGLKSLRFDFGPRWAALT